MRVGNIGRVVVSDDVTPYAVDSTYSSTNFDDR